MDTLNSSPAETVQAPVAEPTPVTSAPEATVAPAATPVAAPVPVPVVDLASSVSGTGTPKANPSTGSLGAGTAPAPAVKMELPKTDGHTVGGWNRFAGYNPNAAKNKQKDGRGGSGGRGR